jgi:hypothetical protein
MGNIFITPKWFYGYDVVLEVLFAVITLLVSFYAWRMYKVSGERNLRLFSMAFLFIAISYIFQSILNFLIMEQFDDDLAGMINLNSVYLLNLFGIYIHAVLFLVGLLLLTYVALRIYSLRTFVLISLLVFTSLYFSPYKTFMLFFTSSLLLGFIVYYYLMNYWASRKATALLVLIAMILLFVGYIHFIFATDNPNYYVVGHLLEFVAYILVLINLLIISKAGKETKGLQRRKNGKKA